MLPSCHCAHANEKKKNEKQMKIKENENEKISQHKRGGRPRYCMTEEIKNNDAA